jgi:hypothetical protein
VPISLQVREGDHNLFAVEMHGTVVPATRTATRSPRTSSTAASTSTSIPKRLLSWTAPARAPGVRSSIQAPRGSAAAADDHLICDRSAAARRRRRRACGCGPASRRERTRPSRAGSRSHRSAACRSSTLRCLAANLSLISSALADDARRPGAWRTKAVRGTVGRAFPWRLADAYPILVSRLLQPTDRDPGRRVRPRLRRPGRPRRTRRP